MRAGTASSASSNRSSTVSRRASNFALRAATAAVGIPLVLVINYLGGWPFALTLTVAAAAATFEFYRMAAKAGHNPLMAAGIPTAAVVAALPVFLPRLQTTSTWIGLIVFFLGATGAYYLSPGAYRGGFVNWVLTLAGVVYVGLLLGHLGLLRELRHGAWWVLYVLVATWAYDTGAFLAGSFFGRRPFMQHVSPSKTWEGVIGGLVFSTVAGLLGAFTLGLAVWQAMGLGLAIGIVAQLGDLLESMMKRQTGVKDSGGIVPGHGGLLDRIDSLLLTGALTYYAAALFGHAS